MTCHKVPFATQAAAQREANLIKTSKGSRGGRLRVYRCDFCGSWHLTSRSKADERRARRERRKQFEEAS